MSINFKLLAADAIENCNIKDAVNVINLAKFNGYDMHDLIENGFNVGMKHVDMAYEMDEIPLEKVIEASKLLKSIYEII